MNEPFLMPAGEKLRESGEHFSLSEPPLACLRPIVQRFRPQDHLMPSSLRINNILKIDIDGKRKLA